MTRPLPKLEKKTHHLGALGDFDALEALAQVREQLGDPRQLLLFRRLSRRREEPDVGLHDVLPHKRHRVPSRGSRQRSFAFRAPPLQQRGVAEQPFRGRGRLVGGRLDLAEQVQRSPPPLEAREDLGREPLRLVPRERLYLVDAERGRRVQGRCYLAVDQGQELSEVAADLRVPFFFAAGGESAGSAGSATHDLRVVDPPDTVAEVGRGGPVPEPCRHAEDPRDDLDRDLRQLRGQPVADVAAAELVLQAGSDEPRDEIDEEEEEDDDARAGRGHLLFRICRSVRGSWSGSCVGVGVV